MIIVFHVRWRLDVDVMLLMNWIPASHWLRVITWPRYWLLISKEWSRDLILTGIRLVLLLTWVQHPPPQEMCDWWLKKVEKWRKLKLIPVAGVAHGENGPPGSFYINFFVPEQYYQRIKSLYESVLQEYEQFILI